MSVNIVLITDTDALAQAIDRYLRCFLPTHNEVFFMTYHHSLLDGQLFGQTDLFVLELLRHDALGFRAEALPIAGKWANTGKKVLIISGAAKSKSIETPCYWDFSAADPLHKRIEYLLQRYPCHQREFQPVRKAFAQYCRPAPSGHH